MSDIVLAKYEGAVYADFDLKADAKPFDAILLLARDGECEGCGKHGTIHFFGGDWCCLECTKETVDEFLSEEKESP